MASYEIQQFDAVRLKTTKNITYVNAPKGTPPPSPHGMWRVVSVLMGSNELLLNKGATLIKVPYLDVYIVGRSRVQKLKEQINGEEGQRIKNEEEVRQPGGDDRSP